MLCVVIRYNSIWKLWYGSFLMDRRVRRRIS